MPINNVTSTLPDQEYIRELENELAEMKAAIQRISQDVRIQNGR